MAAASEGHSDMKKVVERMELLCRAYTPSRTIKTHTRRPRVYNIYLFFFSFSCNRTKQLVLFIRYIVIGRIEPNLFTVQNLWAHRNGVHFHRHTKLLTKL